MHEFVLATLVPIAIGILQHTVYSSTNRFVKIYNVLLKPKVARRGLYSTAALYIADCALAPNYVVPSSISRSATTPSGAGALY
jgi:hypothetical protein